MTVYYPLSRINFGLKKITFLIAVLIPLLSFSQPTYDQSSTKSGMGVGSNSWSHTCSGSDGLLVVGATSENKSVTSVTYNTIPLTKGSSVVGGAAMEVSFWYLVNPPTGAHTVVVTQSGNADLYCGAVSFNGVDQGTPLGTFSTAKANSNAPSLNVTSTASDLAFAILGTIVSNPTPNASQTQTHEIGNTLYNASSTAPGAASVTMSYTMSSEDWVLIGVSIQAAAGLPIQLVNFNAVPARESVELSWSTASEKNNDYYTVERSAEGMTYSEVEKVDGAGNSSHNLFYDYFDFSPLKGLSYYRLKQTDFNGVSTYSFTVSVNIEPQFGETLSVFPNPSNGQDVSISIPDGEPQKDPILVVIRDLTGREAFIKVLPVYEDNNFVIARDVLEELNPGVYIISAASANEVYSKKLVISK